jgi:hypothetical protein
MNTLGHILGGALLGFLVAYIANEAEIIHAGSKANVVLAFGALLGGVVGACFAASDEETKYFQEMRDNEEVRAIMRKTSSAGGAANHEVEADGPHS